MSDACEWFPLSRAEIQAWVTAHRDMLPTTLEELRQFPIPFRREIFLAASGEQRVQWWQAYYADVLATDARLSDLQRACIVETSTLLPQLFAAGSNDPMWAAWKARVRPLFPPADLIRIFQTLGGPEPPEGIPLPPDARPGNA